MYVDDCNACIQRATYLFEKMQGPEAQAHLKELMKKYLDCPKDILCNQEETALLYDYIGQNVLFTEKEARHVCHEFDGVCQRYAIS